jgi:hypothetical protein
MRKILPLFFDLCVVAGFAIILGAAGSSDLGRVEFGTIVRNCFIGLGVMSVGTAGLRLSGSRRFK